MCAEQGEVPGVPPPDACGHPGAVVVHELDAAAALAAVMSARWPPLGTDLQHHVTQVLYKL